MALINFESLLNSEQLAAATAPDGPILVLAAAGTGKTRTLVFRVAHLVQRGLAAQRILLLTFTNKASREMLERARDVVGEGVGGVWGGTFHHMANRLLRRDAARLGYKSDFVILDRDDSRSLVAHCLKARKLDSKEFPKAAVLLSLFGSAASTEKPLDQIAEAKVGPDVVSEVCAIQAAYTQRKRELGAMDFDDLLTNGLRLLREHPDVLRRYQEQFVHVLVDEYQDTNPVQAELVDKMGAGHRNVFVVGDDFQSIYSWRGADFRNIMSFPDRYKGAQVYRLETNYRSVPEVLAVANACIAGNPDQFQKVLRATRPEGQLPVVTRLRDGDEQALFVVETIRRLRREGYGMNEIAVLYRAHYHAIELERMLPRARMPYIITSGVRFFEQAHIKDVCSLLRVIAYPTDELAFTRLLSLLPGVGDRTALKAWVRVGGHFNYQDPSQRAAVRECLRAAALARWQAIEPIFDAAANGTSGDDLIEEFMAVHYAEHLRNTYDNSDQRLDDVQALAEDLAKHASLQEFLSDIALLTNVDGDDADEETGKGESLRLSTIHQAKGLEWRAVIILWATEGMFPSTRALNETEDGEAEERRLFYVAVTRARDVLHICVPEVRRMRDGGVMYCTPSRFVEELPQGLVRQDRAGFL